MSADQPDLLGAVAVRRRASPKPLAMTVQRVELDAPDAVVLIDATGPRGGLQEWTVFLTRRGVVRRAVKTAPEVVSFELDDIPHEILAAARNEAAKGIWP